MKFILECGCEFDYSYPYDSEFLTGYTYNYATVKNICNNHQKLLIKEAQQKLKNHHAEENEEFVKKYLSTKKNNDKVE